VFARILTRFLPVISLAWLTGHAQDGRLAMEAELAKLPVGLKVVHRPVKVRAERAGRSGFAYTWTFQTEVNAMEHPVVIQEFRCLYWDGSRWLGPDPKPAIYGDKEFAEWYFCPGAKLIPGKVYIDPVNWNGHSRLVAQKAKWYFIGTTPDGRRVKGEAVVELLPELVGK
jgi:hypothetical protein